MVRRVHDRGEMPIAPVTLPAPAGSRAATVPRHPKRALHVTLWIAALLGVGVAGAQGVRVLRRPPGVAVVAARQEDVSRMLAVTGRIEADRTVIVTPQFSGRLTEIVHHEGDRVTAGELLARLEDPSATSAVLQQRATLSSRRSELAQAMRELARTQKLVADGAIAGTELETARLVVTQATNDVARLAAVLDTGRSQLVLLAPFAGTIVRRDGELGQLVGPTTPVFEIATVDASRVTAEVDERYVRALRVGMSAQVLPVGSQDPPEAATISYVAQAVDPQTGAATVRFTYAAVPKAALLGMSVDLNVSVARVPGAITIPREAVGSDDGRAFVLVVVDGRVERRAITVEDWPAASVVVLSGIVAGDLIVLDPTAAVAGARVRIEVRDGV